MANYSADDLKTLSWFESVQMRPSMYVGGSAKDETSAGQKNVCCREILDNAFTECIKGKCTHIKVVFKKDGTVWCFDNGRGMPVDNDKEGVCGIDKCCATLHSGGNFDVGEKSGAGLNGVGGSCVNALSSKFKVYVLKGKFKYSKEYSNGEEVSKLEKDKDTSMFTKFDKNIKTGTIVEFKLNDKFFEKQENIILDDLIERLKFTCYVIDNLTIDVEDDINKQKYQFTSKPLSELLEGEEIAPVHTIHTRCKYDNKGRQDQAHIDCVFKYTDSETLSIYSFANTVKTHSGGVHEDAVKDAFFEVMKNEVKNSKGKIKDLDVDDVTGGLTCAISINLPEPQFTSQAKIKLSGASVGSALKDTLKREIRKYIKSLSEDNLKQITNHIQDNYKVRKSAEIAKVAKRKSIKKQSIANLPSNLKDCREIGDENSELYIVEGLSALGTVLAARDAKYQGVLPIRGKILNVYGMDLSNKKQLERFKNNAEIEDINKALGAGIGSAFDIERTRYERVFFSCFQGDTKVKCLDGNSYSFKELVENNVKELWVYSRDEDNNLVPAKAVNPRITRRNQNLVKVTLDNGFVIECTPDHNFMLVDGTYKQAKDLGDEDNLNTAYFDNSEICKVNCNHSIVSVEETDKEEDVYCLTVPKYHNFCIDAGNNKCKAHKDINLHSTVVVKNCDADSDGAAISVLLTGVFYKLFRPMLEQGRVYMTCSPLFTIKSGSDIFYALNDAEKNKITQDLDKKKKKYTLERAKGLGELPKETFSEIVLNPKNRKAIQLTIEDGIEAEKWLDLCLADGTYTFNDETFTGADARKAWMRDNSDVVEGLGADF